MMRSGVRARGERLFLPAGHTTNRRGFGIVSYISYREVLHEVYKNNS